MERGMCQSTSALGPLPIAHVLPTYRGGNHFNPTSCCTSMTVGPAKARCDSWHESTHSSGPVDGRSKMMDKVSGDGDPVGSISHFNVHLGCSHWIQHALVNTGIT